MSYKVTFHTDAYKPHRASKKNWGPGTRNDEMKALDGRSYVEKTVPELRWRIHMVCGNWPHDLTDDTREEYIAWRRDKRNIISYVDHFCEITRTMYPEVPGYAQGYVNIDAVVLKVLRDGSARLDFKCFYDIRQYDKNMDGCYVTIEKID